MKKLLILLAFFLPSIALAAITVPAGGTGSTTLTGILFGNGTGIVRSLTVGSGLTLTGTTLSTTGGSSASSTLLGDTNTFSGTDIFSNTIKVGSLGGFIGGNAGTLYGFATSTIKTSQLTNDANFLTAAVTSVTASYPLASSGGATPNITTSFGTTTNNGMTAGFLYSGAGGIWQTGASSTLFGYTPLNPTRAINTTYPLQGGGDLSADRTLTSAFGTTSNTGITAGNLYIGSDGVFKTSASSSIFGYTPLNPTRALTFNGTTNQITSSAGSQDLSADRTWTFALANHVIFPSGGYEAALGSTTAATSTYLAVTGSSTLATIQGAGLSSCNSASSALTWNAGTFGCNSIASAAFTYPFPTLGLGTTSPIMLLASTTIGNGAQNGGLTISGNATTTGNELIQGASTIGTTTSNALNKLLTVEGNATGGIVRFQRDLSSTPATSSVGTFDTLLNETGSANLANFTGPTQTFGISLAGGAENILGDIGAYRFNADNTGEFIIRPYSAGSPVGAFYISPLGVGVASTTPFAEFSIHAAAGNNFVNNALFAIGSTTAVSPATTTLFSISNTGAITTQLGNALVLSGGANTALSAYGGTGGCIAGTVMTALSGVGGSTCTNILTEMGTQNANTILGNATGASAIPTFFATSTLFTGTAGQGMFFTGTGAFSGTNDIFDSSAKIGVGSTTPFSRLSVGTGAASSSITVAEYKYGIAGNVATSTAANIDCNASTQIAWPIGASATTLTLINLVPGKTCRVVVQNPNQAAGAITWAVQTGAILKWTGGTVPTQTTTANTYDVWSFLATQGSSTMEVIGAATLNN